MRSPPDLAGEEVVLWWGLFDQELYVEHGDRRSGPFTSVGGPIPLHKYRKFQKSKADERADRVAALADRIGLPRAALDGGELPSTPSAVRRRSRQTTLHLDPVSVSDAGLSLSIIAAKLAVADEIGMALAKVTAEDRAFIDALLRETLAKRHRARPRASALQATGPRGAGDADGGDGALQLARDLTMAGYYETDHHRQLGKDVRAAIRSGRLVAIAGVMGSVATVLLRRLQDELAREGKVLVSKSLSVDKDRTTIPTLIDPAQGPQVGMPWLDPCVQGSTRVDNERKSFVNERIRSGERRGNGGRGRPRLEMLFEYRPSCF